MLTHLKGRKFNELGINTLVLNHITLEGAGKSLWRDARARYAVLILSPELLVSDDFESLIGDTCFKARVCALGVDEVHLCQAWGTSGFRPQYTQIGFVHARLPTEQVVLILSSATLVPGPNTQSTEAFFGLQPGGYHLIRRSNRRRDIKIIFRTVQKLINDFDCQDIHWVVRDKRKTIIFADSIAHGWRIIVGLREYFRATTGASDTEAKAHIQLYSALTAEDNVKALRAFRETSAVQILVATDALMVGVDLPNVQDVLLLSPPRSIDEMLQKIGRAGRDHNVVKDARAGDLVASIQKMLAS